VILGINKKLICGLAIGTFSALAFASAAFSQAEKAAAAKQLKVTGAKLLVDDFEKASKNNLLGGLWQVEIDKNKVGTTMTNMAKFIVPGGANGSKYSGEITGHFGKMVAPWPFASINTSLDSSGGPVDLSQFSAVEFMAKGDGKSYVFLVYVSQVKDFAHFRMSFVAPKVWTKIHVDLKKLVQPDWGVKVKADYHSVLELLFAPLTLNDESYDLAIDDVTLVK